MTEIWVTIKGYPSYEVSNFGNVRSLDRVIIRKRGKPYIRKGVMLSKIKNAELGYYVVSISDEFHNPKLKTIHRIVAENFIPLVEGKNIINHIDGNRLNNNVSNLEWCTYSENIIHSYKFLRKPIPKSQNKKTGQTHVYINSKIIIDLSVGVFYESISEAARAKSIKRSTLEGYLNGTRKNKTTLVYA